MDATDDLEPKLIEGPGRPDHRQQPIDRLVALHERDVRSALRRVLGRSGEEDDLVQEVFVRLVIRLRQPGELCVGAWLRGVAHNLAVDEVRRRRPLPVEQTHLDAAVTSPLDEELAGAELWSSVVRGARELPERQRRALVASLAGGGEARVSSVATRLGVSVHAAESLLSRARSGLRLHLAGATGEAGSLRATVATVAGALGAAIGWLVRRWRQVSVATVLTGSLATAALLPPSHRAVPSPGVRSGVAASHPAPSPVARPDGSSPAAVVDPPAALGAAAATTSVAPADPGRSSEPGALVIELPSLDPPALPAIGAGAPCPIAAIDPVGDGDGPVGVTVTGGAPELVPAGPPPVGCDALPASLESRSDSSR